MSKPEVIYPANPVWVTEALRYEGVTEVKGKKHNQTIVNWLVKLNAWWKEDETPWCGVFTARIMQVVKLKYPETYMRALAWNDWGVKLDKPALGCIVTFTRSGGGHVGFVVGKDKNGNLMVLGGNQGDQVNIKPFATSRVSAYRWPSEMKKPVNYNLPILNSNGKVSTNEA